MPKRKKKVEKVEVFGQKDWGNECSISVIGGRELRCPAFPEPCSYVRVLDDDGEELGYWNKDEWEESPEEVMGAIIGALKGREDE